MYPIKFKALLHPMIWGGTGMAAYKGIESNLPRIGESWEISAIKGNETLVANGEDANMILPQLIEKYGKRLLGQHVMQQFGGKFPLLIKFIDAARDLSIQVHPNDALAMQRHGSFGKTEMWYIIKAQPGAGLYSGLARELTPERYETAVADGTFMSYLQHYEVKPGDVFFLPAGRIHAIGGGCLLAEIQQSSDVTYRIFDYGRLDDKGNPRELHTTLAKDAIDYTVMSDYRTHYTAEANRPQEVVNCPYFKTSVLNLTTAIEIQTAERDSFSCYICLQGSLSLTDDAGHTISLHQGETCLIAADCKQVSLTPEGECRLLQCYV